MIKSKVHMVIMVYIIIKIRNYILRKNSKFKKFLKNIGFKKFERFNSSESSDGSGFRSSNSSKSSKTVVFSKALSILISQACGSSVEYTVQ